MSKLSTSLDPDNLDKLTFLHKNFVFPEPILVGGMQSANSTQAPAAVGSAITEPTTPKDGQGFCNVFIFCSKYTKYDVP